LEAQWCGFTLFAQPHRLRDSSAFRGSAEELLEKHNYVVLYFDNNADRLLAFLLFDIHTVRDS
jgi:hypothetical protein